MVKIISSYIHQYDLDYVSILEPIKEEILQEYLNLKEKKGVVTDMALNNSKKEFEEINSKLNQIVEENYFIGEKLHGGELAAYVQNNKNNTSMLHHHANSRSAICGVFYLNIPKEGGEIMFRCLENNSWGDEIIIKPQLNKVYLFPYWLPHTPLPQQDENFRICFNWGHGSIQRPIHKFFLYPW